MAKQIPQLPHFLTVRSDMLVPLIDLTLGNDGSGYALLSDALAAGTYPTLTGEVAVTDNRYNYGDVRRYGALSGAVIDATNAFRNCVTSTKGQPIRWEMTCEGSYLLSDEILFDVDGLHFHGTGVRASTIYFKNTVAKAVFRLQKATATTIVQCSIKRITFIGHGSSAALQKIAIDAYDISECEFDQLATQLWTGNSGSALTPSCALRTNGRDSCTVTRYSFSADRPVWFRANPNHANLDVDSFHFNDGYCLPQVATESSYHFESGLGVYNLVIDGRQNWVGGKYGVFFAKTGAMRGVGYNNQIGGTGRFEQSGDATGYCVFWEGTTQELILNNINTGGVPAGGVLNHNGFWIKGAYTAIINGCHYEGTANALTVDGTTMQYLDLRGFFAQAGSTVVTTGFNQTFSDHPQTGSTLPIPPFSSWTTNTKTDKGVRINAVPVDCFVGTLANGAVMSLALASTGFMKCAIVQIIGRSSVGPIREGGVALVTPEGATVSGSANFVTTDTAGKLCILAAGAASVQIKNNTGQTLDLAIMSTTNQGTLP